MEERGSGANEGAREERGRKGAREGWKLQGRYPEEDTVQYTVHKTTHNMARALDILVLQMKNSERV